MTTFHKNVKRFNKDGREVPNVGPLAEGDTLRVPMNMMDANSIVTGAEIEAFLQDKFGPPVDTSRVRHYSGFVEFERPVIDVAAYNAQADISYAERKDRLSRAWMQPVSQPATPLLARDAAIKPPSIEAMPSLDGRNAATAQQVDAALSARDARLQNMWKAPAA
jgi:hypothetical protein